MSSTYKKALIGIRPKNTIAIILVKEFGATFNSSGKTLSILNEVISRDSEKLSRISSMRGKGNLSAICFLLTAR